MKNNGWDYNNKASWVWYLIGLLGGLGYIIGLIYVLVSNNKNRVWSLFFLLGPIGSIILYFVFRRKDNKLANISIKLLVGYIISTVVAIVVSFIFVTKTFSMQFGYL